MPFITECVEDNTTMSWMTNVWKLVKYKYNTSCSNIVINITHCMNFLHYYLDIQSVLGHNLKICIQKINRATRVQFFTIQKGNSESFIYVTANLSCFQKSQFSIICHLVSKSLMNEKAQFKIPLKRYLNTHSFYSVDEFPLSKNDPSI
jgi:hypothetical protein